MTPEDEQLFREMRIEPCDVLKETDRTWGALDTALSEANRVHRDMTEADIHTITANMGDFRAAQCLLDKKDQLIGNLSRTVEAMEGHIKHLDGMVIKWKLFGWSGWAMVGLFIWRGMHRW